MADRVPERVPGNSVPADDIRDMFDRIAPVYDRMNTVMTAGLDARWRRVAARATGLARGATALDVACGTGALTRELARCVGPSGTVLGVDVSVAMLAQARALRASPGSAPITYLRGDALALPIGDDAVDAATIAFGLRNVTDRATALRELRRAVRPGGRVVVLEIATPRGRMGRWVAGTWFRRAVPLLGRIVGSGAAYAYLPDSVITYPAPETIGEEMQEAGLVDVGWRGLALGMVTLHHGRVP